MAIRHDYTTPQHERDYTAVLLSCTVTTVCAATSVLLLLAAAAAICAVAAAAVVVVVVAVVSGRLGTCRGCDPRLPMPIHIATAHRGAVITEATDDVPTTTADKPTYRDCGYAHVICCCRQPVLP